MRLFCFDIDSIAVAINMLEMLSPALYTHTHPYLQVLHASLDRLQRWPEGGTPEWQPEAIRDGLFVVSCWLRHGWLLGLYQPPGFISCWMSAPLSPVTYDNNEEALLGEQPRACCCMHWSASLIALTVKQPPAGASCQAGIIAWCCGAWPSDGSAQGAT